MPRLFWYWIVYLPYTPVNTLADYRHFTEFLAENYKQKLSAYGKRRY